MTHPVSIYPPSCDDSIPAGEGETGWEAWDAATWRSAALDLLYVDLERAYLALGCKSIAQYADWEMGLTRGYTTELLRIARKLLDLPEIDRELCAGKLTWEQVVVLTRVAVPQHEYAWLDRALEVPLEELTQSVERSAEGWAPPVDVFSRGARPPSGSRLGRAADGTAARSKIALCSPDEGWLHVSRMAAVQIVAAHAVRARPGRVWRRAIAPNVRQPFHAPPSTS